MRPGSVRSAVLAGFERLALEIGLEPFALARSVGLDPRCLRSPDIVMPARTGYRLMELAASIAGVPDLGLRLSSRGARLSSIGALGLLVRDEPDVRSALRRMISDLSLHSTCIDLQLRESAGVAVIRLDVDPDGELVVRQATESAVGAMVYMLRNFLGPGWRPVEVRFVHRCAGTDRPHRSLFGCPVRFAMAYNELLLPAGSLDHPVPLADSRLRRYAGPKQAQRRGAGIGLEQIRPVVARLLQDKGCTAAAVADGLGISRRTLDRRLAAAGVSFAGLRTQLRLARARQYLAAGSIGMAEIAALLGFAN
jgi:AraC-like DNA-binding protein